jgi:hypothetical protein
MSGEPRTRRASHPILLAFRMAAGALVGFVFSLPFFAVGNAFDPWFRAGPFVFAIGGSLLGLCVELYTRVTDERARCEILLAAFVCVVMVIIWTGLIR